jgi:hypothetical protein
MFSACGKYLLAKAGAEMDVVHIPRHMLSPERHKRLTGEAVSVSRHHSTGAVTLASDIHGLEIIRAGLGRGTVMSESQLASVGEDNKPTVGLLITADLNDVKLQGTRSNSSQNQESLKLLSLPESFDTRHTSVSIKLPDGPDGALRVMFNKKTAERYSLSDGGESPISCRGGTESHIDDAILRGLPSCLHPRWNQTMRARRQNGSSTRYRRMTSASSASKGFEHD